MGNEMYSYEEFDKFLNELTTLGIVNEATARNLKDASLRLLATYDPSDEEDVRDLDLDEIVNRYSETSGVDVSNASLQAYKSRLSSAIKKFIDYQKDNQIDDEQEDSAYLLKKRSPSRKVTSATEVKTFELPIPIRDGLILRVHNLPMDLTIDEADRIANIIKSFAIR
ncbi:hypothetical protein [Enterobacter ludwigii]|uniref:hypothetical protein n=1 Tax=Enterobacter ludwigii TaxID=299767 RepID=UPI002E2C5D83|nr:hypothetical protein [Enterobacter ludwigii]MED5697572.1 hypothetical protein [Enterobacter ludwigii]